MSTFERTLIIHSSDRIHPEEPVGSFTCALDTHLESYKLRRVIVKQVSFLNTIPNVTPDMQLFFRLTDSAGALTRVSLPQGQVDVDQLLAALTVAVADSGVVTLTAAAVSDTGFITLTFSQPVYVLSINEILQVDPSAKRSLNKILGARYTNTSNVTPAGADTWTFPNVVGLAGPMSLHLHSNELGRGNAFEGSGQVSSVLATIPITAAYGEYQHWAPNETMMAYVDASPGQQWSLPRKVDMSLKLSDDDSVAQFSENTDISVSLLVVLEA